MSPVTAKRFSLEEYHQLAELGFFQEKNRVELIRGEIVYMAAKGVAHEVCITRLCRELLKQIGDTATIRCQSPILLPIHSEPEPDFVIVRNRIDDYMDGHPQPEDILLLVEVSDSSIAYDQSNKLSLYAEYDIAHYWIFNLLDAVLECYKAPYQNPKGSWAYRSKQIYLPTDSVVIPNLPMQT
ncbi:Uma2 family endonuclease, partial [Synechococcus sp. PCC 7335]|uniref:Uma2 family endonuclease n=1 Tax=Synechococcus sp. (strain ATCC 29403 / PCC 7335) TaxID=91464 RepID=UPI0002FFBE61